MVSEWRALESLRAKLAGAAFVIGACAGFMKGWYLSGELNLILETVIGGLAVPMAGVAGGVAGLVIRLGAAHILGKEQGPGEPLDAPAILLLGVVAGSFSGIVGSLLFADPGSARFGALIGSVGGGLIMAAAGDMGDILIRMTMATGDVDLDEDTSPLESLDEPEAKPNRDSHEP